MQRKLLSFTAICVADADADAAFTKATVAVIASGACDEAGVSSVAAQPTRLSVLKVANNTEASKGEASFMVLFSKSTLGGPYAL
jgi:hypothetical protein